MTELFSESDLDQEALAKEREKKERAGKETVSNESRVMPSYDKRLYLIDGYSVIYRNYFAHLSNPLTDKNGTNISAYFGFFSTLFSLVLGLPLGVLLHITGKEEAGGIMPHPVFNNVLSRIVDILRSFPFIILLIVLIPLSRIIVGTSIGTKAAIVPLSIAAAPFVARIIESALKEVDPGVMQAAKAMGSTNWQLVYKVLIPEAMPSLMSGLTLTIINLIGYSAMAGTIGGGGLGDLAIRYGYQRFRPSYIVAAVIVILVIVEVIQLAGDRIVKHMMSHR